ncbi:MAG TPA: tetratricopeptide repeat protein [Myxococcota bacterium]|nr:tetratricopeptide repeat protein [Myxococcota bacterium]
MNEEQDAERLARWLEDPSTDPPPELDPEVVGAIYTLSPKHRPAPRLSVDEILAGVTEGPFAAPAAAPVEKNEGRRDRIRSSSQGSSQGAAENRTVAPPRRAPPSRRWVLPVVGTAMAGMLVLLIVVPGMFLQLGSEPKVDATTPMPKMAATTPPRPMASEPTEIPEAEAPASAPASAPVMAPPPMAPMGSAAPAASVQVPVAQMMPSGGSASADAPSLQGGATRSAATGDAIALPAEAPAPEDAGTVANTASPDPNSALDEDNGAFAEERSDALNEEQVIAEAARRPTNSREKKTTQAPAAAGASYAPPPAPAAAKTEAMEDDEPPIWPQDYRERWYVGDAEVEPIYQSAQALEQTGQWTAAAVAYRPLLSSGRSSVAQDAAWRCASAWWKAGQGSTALSAIEEGLRRSSANTPYRARLFALKGDILSAQGKAAQAEAAWREARALNASR